MVTKQQQLEWLASSWPKWYHTMGKVFMSRTAIGDFVSMINNSHQITREEWQQERDKMNSKPEVDNSWNKYGELPPCGVPVELWVGGSFAYNCEFITRRSNHYVMWNLDADRPDAADYMNSEFRPLRTEREKAIDEMVSILKAKFDRPGVDGIAVSGIVNELYDAGYRKVKP